ncbi:hypothetical protein FHX42_001871 [Saccharopolyspora lacisalsi]|uniref:Uncharacterized protein n=1 Tax=Halosaccharopolyspora lacisalsi TaxID=1000566 RepID=A0A839DSN6_9PSEU|nr:hypothetical protein [Halosaccharopolyspora lacisalsi]MBA8824524.1 hypothetical protein [Halosaccharopolyspora lacisalsi]
MVLDVDRAAGNLNIANRPGLVEVQDREPALQTITTADCRRNDQHLDVRAFGYRHQAFEPTPHRGSTVDRPIENRFLDQRREVRGRFFAEQALLSFHPQAHETFTLVRTNPGTR